MLRLEQLEYLQAVERFNSVKLAAEALLVVPSTISTSLHKMEKETNVKLLVRTHRGIELTEAAREIAAKAKDVFATMNEIEQIIEKYNDLKKSESDVENHALTVYMSRGYYQSSLNAVFELFDKYGLTVECPDLSRGNETYLKYVNDDENSILFNYFVEPAQELVDGFSNVKYIRLNSSRPCIIFDKNHPFFAPDKEEVTAKEALQLPFLMFNEGYDLALQIFEWLEEQGQVNIVGKYSNITVMSAMLERGKGVSVSAESGMMLESKEAFSQVYRMMPIKCDMRISLLLCFNRKLSSEKQKILRQIAKEIS